VPQDGRLQEDPLTVPLRRDDIAVIGADVIMSKVVLDICREVRPVRRRSSTRADFPASMRPQKRM
jgi:hypothetical protein